MATPMVLQEMTFAYYSPKSQLMESFLDQCMFSFLKMALLLKTHESLLIFSKLVTDLKNLQPVNTQNLYWIAAVTV